MSERKWISFSDTGEGSASETEVSKTVTQLATAAMQDAGQRIGVTVTYKVGGFWEGVVEGEAFQSLEVPSATQIEQEGAPAVPKDGIFVAVPADAVNVEVRVIDKKMMPLEREVYLAPAPQQFKEDEFRVVYQPDPAIYEADTPFPGRDFDFLGLKTIAGLKVAHILVYLGQYWPKSRRMELVQLMTLEVTYQTPPARDRHPSRKPRELPEHSLILGLDLIDEERDFSSRVEDFSQMSDVDLEVIEATLVPSRRPDPGISLLEAIESEGQDPSLIGAGMPENAVLADAPKLKIPGLIAEYVIVTSSALSASVEPLRSAKSGWPYYGKVALTEDIRTEFPSASLKDSIKLFITWATANWKVPPRFVVLAGDTDIIPMHIYVQNGESYASDHYYADISGDLVPELTVSRLPTSDAATLKSICEHLVRYGLYRGGDWGGWQNQVMLCAYASSTYETTCDDIEAKIKSRYQVIKRYAKNTSKADVLKTMNDSVLFSVYRGHGSKTAWSATNGLNASDVASLNNLTRPPFVLSICCQNGWVDDNSLETIAEAFIRRRKAVAVFASSRNSWTYPNNDFAKYLFDAVMSGGCYSPADIICFAKTKMVRNHGSSSYHQDNTVMYNLFGEPTAHVASNAEYLRGSWAMDHDGWQGTLNVTRIWNYRIENSAGYSAPVWSVSGTYVGSDNKSYNFVGTLGGFDPNQLGTGSKRSDLKFDINIAFSSSNNQRFVGYVHSWTRNRISGLCWWSNHPFGWTASKK
jgi:hypothetical protein